MFFAPDVGIYFVKTYEIREEKDLRSWSNTQSKFLNMMVTFRNGYDINQVASVF